MKKILLALLPGGLALVGLIGAISLFRVTAQPLQAAEGDLIFIDSGQSLGNSNSRDVALADLDGDGDLDAFVANDGTANRVWLNDGNGIFSDSGQSLGTGKSYGVALGKINDDDHLDAFIANYGQPNRVWLNDGDGFFSNSNQTLGSAPSNDVALADLDGDTDLDAFVANGSASEKANKVWLNDGNGTFSDSGQSLGTSWSEAVALGKLDGNTSVDAFVANGSSSQNSNKVYNNTAGVFSDSGQLLGFNWTNDVALALLDGDQHLDAFTANWFPLANKVWINDGNGAFADSGQSLGNAGSTAVALADVDDDSDVDALVGNFSSDNEVWLNDGDGNFTDSGLALDSNGTWSVALGDLDGDGDPDAFIANQGPNKVWINGQPGLPNAVFRVDRQINEGGKEVFYSASAGNAMLPIVLGQPITQTIDVHIRIDSTSGVTTQTIPFSSGQLLKILNLVNPNPDPSEELVLTLFVTLPGGTPAAGSHTDMLSFFFVDGSQSPEEVCLLCFNEWLARLLGFDPIFGALHHLSLPEQKASPQWRYYTLLFEIYTPEIRDIVATNPAVLWDTLTTLDEWTGPLQDLDDGNGATVTVTQSMVDNGIELVEGIKDEASPGLAAVITHEQNAVDMPSFVGLNMEEAWDNVVANRPVDELYVTVLLK